MRIALDRIEPFDAKTKQLNVVVETPRGSAVKYVYDPDLGAFRFKRALSAGLVFPFNFGFIPSTMGEDGDPLDIVVLNEEPLFPGCLLKVHLLALLKVEQAKNGRKIRNDRFVGFAPSADAPAVLDAVPFDQKMRKEVELFFATYDGLYGKKFKVIGETGPREALKTLRETVAAQRKKRSKH